MHPTDIAKTSRSLSPQGVELEVLGTGSGVVNLVVTNATGNGSFVVSHPDGPVCIYGFEHNASVEEVAEPGADVGLGGEVVYRCPDHMAFVKNGTTFYEYRDGFSEVLPQCSVD